MDIEKARKIFRLVELIDNLEEDIKCLKNSEKYHSKSAADYAAKAVQANNIREKSLEELKLLQ